MSVMKKPRTVYVAAEQSQKLSKTVTAMTLKEAWTGHPNLADRNPSKLNDHLLITFEESIGEPDHTHSEDCLWKFSFKCFNVWKGLCYCLLTSFCAIPHAICWGCTFACVAFVNIWELTPCIRCFEICIASLKKFYTLWLQAICRPLCEAIGGVFIAFKRK